MPKTKEQLAQEQLTQEKKELEDFLIIMRNAISVKNAEQIINDSNFIRELDLILTGLSSGTLEIEEIRKKMEIASARFISYLNTVTLTEDSIPVFKILKASIGKAIADIETIEAKKPKKAQEHWLLSGLKSIFKMVAVLATGVLPGLGYIAYQQHQETKRGKLLAEAKKSFSESKKEQMENEKKEMEKKKKEAFDEDVNQIKDLSNDEKVKKLGERDGNIYVKIFNHSPKKAIELLPDSLKTPEGIAKFLKDTPGLDKRQVGEYLGEEDKKMKGDLIKGFHEKILHAYVQKFNFENKSFTTALREFLGAFRIPGEAQKIDRFMEAFATRFDEQHPNAFQDKDTAFITAFATLQLNTDRYNPGVKTKMTLENFIKGVRDAIKDNQWEQKIKEARKESKERKKEEFSRQDFEEKEKKTFNAKFEKEFGSEHLKNILTPIYEDILKNEIKLKDDADVRTTPSAGV